MKDFIYKKLIVYLVLLQPVIDIITSYMVINNMSVSIGIFIKIFVMFLAFIYLVFLDNEHNKKFNYLYLALIMIFCSLNIFNNMDIIKLRFFSYISYLVKYVYHLIMLLFFIRWYKGYGIKLYDLRVPIMIITFTYFLAYFTNTAYLSYGGNSKNLGYSGWYSSANELGNILCLLFPVALYNAFHNKDGIFFDKILFVLTGIAMLMLGTKVGLFGFIGVLVTYIFGRLVFIKYKKLDYRFLAVVIFLGSALACYNYLPTIENMKMGYNRYENVEDMMLSGRGEFLKEIKKRRENIDLYDRAIGKSFINLRNSDILIVEQDFYDVYFMYGIVGILLLMLIYFKVYAVFLKKVIDTFKNPRLLSKKYFAVIVAVTLELAVAFISGHALLSPSVSTYLTLLVAMSISIEIKHSSNKKSILISSNSSFANKIDASKYSVYYLVVDKEIDNVNKVYPYCHNWKFLKTKVGRQLFYNKFMLWNIRKNQVFDYVIGDNSLSMIERNYLSLANGQKVLVGKKKDKYFNEIISVKDINNL